MSFLTHNSINKHHHPLLTNNSISKHHHPNLKTACYIPFDHMRENLQMQRYRKHS